MTCHECEDAQAGGLVAYARVDVANVAIVGCRKHVRVVLEAIRAYKGDMPTEE